MEDIHVRRYEHDHEWDGYVEPADNSWILFVPTTGPPTLFTDRNPETGAVQ